MSSAENPQPRQSEDKYVVRFPDGMRDRLKEEAAKNNRSMNAEIIARLQQSFEDQPKANVFVSHAASDSDEDIAQTLSDICAKLDKIIERGQASIDREDAPKRARKVTPSGEVYFVAGAAKNIGPNTAVNPKDIGPYRLKKAIKWQPKSR